MPVEDHPVHEKVRFKEVPLSPCHSTLPDKTKDHYHVMNLRYTPAGIPYHAIVRIQRFHDNTCKQDGSLPECRGCK